MATGREALRDWHRLFGLVLADFFSGTPFTVEVERDLSEQQQFLDAVIFRRGRGRLRGRLPDGFDPLAEHNLLTFKSHREALDSWTMKELVGHSVAYRKLLSPSPSELLPEDLFRLYAVCARFPDNLARQVPWQRRQAGVYDCTWGTDVVRVIVAGELPREAHNAPLHLFSASPELVRFGGQAYRQRSELTSRVLRQLVETMEAEGLAMAYTIEDFNRDYTKKHFPQLTVDEQREALELLPPGKRRALLDLLLTEWLSGLPLEDRLAGLSPDQIQHYLDRLTARRPSPARKRRRKQ